MQTHRCAREVAWPSTWEARQASWARNEVLRMDWGQTGSPRDKPLPDNWFASTSPVALDNALVVGPTPSGQLLAFSAHAVNAALRVWRGYELQFMGSTHWYVNWLNGVFSGRWNGYRSGYGIRGIDVMDCGRFQVLFCPEVLGPLARIDGDAATKFIAFNEELDVRYGEDGLFVRGPQLAEGYWHSGEIIPAAAEGGWGFIPLKDDLRRDVLDW